MFSSFARVPFWVRIVDPHSSHEQLPPLTRKVIFQTKCRWERPEAGEQRVFVDLHMQMDAGLREMAAQARGRSLSHTHTHMHACIKYIQRYVHRYIHRCISIYVDT